MKQQFDTEKKPFWWLGVLPAALSFVLMFLAFDVEAVVVGVIALVLNFRHKSTHRIWFAVALTVLALLGAAMGIAFLLWLGLGKHGEISYWLFQVLF